MPTTETQQRAFSGFRNGVTSRSQQVGYQLTSMNDYFWSFHHMLCKKAYKSATKRNTKTSPNTKESHLIALLLTKGLALALVAEDNIDVGNGIHQGLVKELADERSREVKAKHLCTHSVCLRHKTHIQGQTQPAPCQCQRRACQCA